VAETGGGIMKSKGITRNQKAKGKYQKAKGRHFISLFSPPVFTNVLNQKNNGFASE
jgi:hypothetical protein